MAATTLPYIPTEAEGARFWSAFQNEVPRPTGLPQGYPKALNSPLAWTPDEVRRKESEWYLRLSEDDIKSIDDALAAFESQFSPLNDENLSKLSPETFNLPSSLIGRLRQVSDQCYNGIGFKIIRGLDPSKYTDMQNAIIYAGVASHVAPKRGFVDLGYERVISHIVNAVGENEPTTVKAPPGLTNTALSFHTDNCEIMGLFCLEAAATGGKSLIASSWNVYNELAAKRPDILSTLCGEWVLDTFKDYNWAPPRHRRFLDKSGEDKVIMRFSRYGMTGWQEERNPQLPTPTPAQVEAIDAVQFIATANALRIALVDGDMLFVNDMALMHARDSFTEDGQYLKRHYLKMLFRDPAQSWPVPEYAKNAWNKIYGPNLPDGGRKELWDPSYIPGLEGGEADNG